MHWINRGPEPEKLRYIREQYTLRWVQYYRHGDGNSPNDVYWRDFYVILREMFHGLCAYCEKRARGEVEHFRPKSRYPELVYSWSNWLFACHDCNHAKGWKWPPGGYVNPCAKSRPARPEIFFGFDIETGEILPKTNLSAKRRRKAQNTIEELGLNEWHHLKNRVEWLHLVSAIIPDDPTDLEFNDREMRAHFVSRTTPYSSIIRTWLSERGHPANY